MDIALITNGFFITPKTEEIRMLLKRAFEDRGVVLSEMRNDRAIAWQNDMPKVDRVLFWDKDVLLARRLEGLNIRVVNSSKAIETCDDKGATSIAAMKAGLKMPVTVIAPFTYANIGYDNVDFLRSVTDKIDFPIVVKESHGSFGQQVYLARNIEELKATTKRIAPKPMIFQQYIECGNSDLRLQVVGDKVVASVRRASVNGDFRANATLGGIMTKYEPTKAEKMLALQAAEAVGAEIAGVDILPGDVPRLCEVNANAHFKRLMDATGEDVAGFIADYMIKL